MTQRRNLIGAYIHCKRCVAEERTPNIAVGITVDGAGVQVWCERHDAHVASFALKESVAGMICAVCGQPLGPDHKH